MPFRINSVLGLMKHITSTVKTVKDGALEGNRGCSQGSGLGLALMGQLELQHGLLKSSTTHPASHPCQSRRAANISLHLDICKEMKISALWDLLSLSPKAVA